MTDEADALERASNSLAIPGAMSLDALFEYVSRLTKRRFQTVLADPPWNETGGGKVKRGADRHYPLLKTKEMPGVMMEECPHWADVADTAHLYLWVTNNFLPDGLWLMEQLGFRYVTNRAWAKDRFGLGQYYRGQHELCLFGVRGKGYDVLKARGKLSTLIGSGPCPHHGLAAMDISACHACDSNGRGSGIVPRGKHSAKPEIFYDEVETASAGPYLELFARSNRPGWQSWGNEI